MHLFGSLKLLMALLGPSWPLLGPIWSKTGPKLVHQLFENLSNKCLNCPNCPKTCPRKNTKKPSPRRRANNLQQKCLWQRGGRPRARLRQSHKRTLHRRRLQRRGLGEPQDRPSGVGRNVKAQNEIMRSQEEPRESPGKPQKAPPQAQLRPRSPMKRNETQ